MATRSLDAIRSGLTELVGIEGAEKVLDESIAAAHLTKKDLYSPEEFNAICGQLRAKGGSIKIVISLLLAREKWQ